MNCYYQIEDGPWVKGEIVSMSGGRQVNFHSRDDQGHVSHQITLSVTEGSILFHGGGFSVCGYVPAGKEPDKANRVGSDLYKLARVDVRWTKPRTKHDR